ncbi:MAG: hypothetical protein OHK0039_39020 [Bacteroidia bacterium]
MFVGWPATAQPTPPLPAAPFETVVYPNPFTDTFTVETNSPDLMLDIYTLDGQRIPATIYRHHHNGRVRYMSGHELSRGLYLVRLTSPQGHDFAYKLMKTE